MQRAQNILNADSKDGRAQNVARFSSELMRTVRPGDSFKAESSRNVIQHMLHEVASKLQDIVHLFDRSLTVKTWQANELKFLDSKKSSLEELNNTLQKVQEAIITNINLLKRRTNSTTEQDAEAKRQKKSSARNARKSMKEKEERLQKVKDVLRLLTNGMLTLNAIKNREDMSIQLADIDKSCELTATFHAKAIKWLMENGYFSADSLEFANQLSRKLTIQLEKSNELTNARLRKLASTKLSKRPSSTESSSEPQLNTGDSECDGDLDDNDAPAAETPVSTSRPLAAVKKSKTAKQKKEEEELSILKSLASSISADENVAAKKDAKPSPSAAFEEYVTHALSVMDEKTRLVAMNNIQNAIFQAQMGSFSNEFNNPYHAGQHARMQSFRQSLDQQDMSEGPSHGQF
eukprot:gene4309-4881_t